MTQKSILKRFIKNLQSFEYPDSKTSWNVAGILKNQNAFYKFDVKDMYKLSNGELVRSGKTNSKADKCVLEFKNKWVIIDTKELYSYIKINKTKKVYLETLLNKLEWNILIDK